MNIICNNCIGSYLYQINNKQFTNPFCWCSVWLNDFISLTNNYNIIDFSKPVFELEKYGNYDYKTVLCRLNDIKIHYIHYINDLGFTDKPNIIGPNVRYSNILEYAKEKWFLRLNRCTETPIFVYSFNYTTPDNPKYTEFLNKLLQVKNELTIIVHDTIKVDKIPKNINLQYAKTDEMKLSGINLAKALQKYIL